MGQYLIYIPLLLVALFLFFFIGSDFKLTRTVKYLKPLTVNINNVLTKKFSYYSLLTSTEKERFIFRVKKFIVNKNWESRGTLIITDEMKVLIAATAIQLTFGLPPIILKYFSKIIIYPTKYYSPITKTNNIGEVNQRGIIVLSWDHFLKGIDRPHDGLNVGLHEMSHALKLENVINNGEYGFLPTFLLGQLHRQGIIEMKKIRQGQNTFIRKYAATNQEEFFAVCVEFFFEKPKTLQLEAPHLYRLLSQLLKQDPVKRLRKK